MNEYRTQHSAPSRGEDIIDLGNAPELVQLEEVRDYVMRVKKIVTTDEAKVQVVLETEGATPESLDQLKAMVSLQQACPVLVSMQPAQKELFHD